MRRAVTAVVALSSVVHAARTPLHSRHQYEALFYDWMLEHDITIPAGPEYVLWLNNFIENNDHIELQNGKNLSYTLAHNHFSHLSFEEFQQKYLGWERPLRLAEPEPVAVMRRSLRSTVAYAVATVDDGMDDATLEKLLPKSVDWVAKGAVSSVKDQGQCGSCYTFSATGAVEGAYAIKHGKMVELSMQQVVDCDNLDGGCAGGEMTNVFKWIRQNGGLCALTDYPYSSGTTEKADVCHKCQVVAGTAPSSWKMVFPGSDLALRAALTKGPVSVAVGASKDWMFYKEGIFNGQCEAQLNHGILAVGYDETADGKFWKVKNSWSQNWGMDGYILLSRDQTSEACGVLQDSSYPILPDATSASSADTLVERVAVVEAVESGTRRGSASSKDCGGGTAVFDTINITPDDIAKNQLITLEASGILNKPTTDGTYRLSVVFAGGELYSHSGSLCGKEKVELPLGVGVVNIYGLDCPAMPGPVTYGLDVKLPAIAPSGTYEIKITGNDQDGVPAVCIDTTLSI